MKKQTKDDFFVKENLQKETESLSPSGQFKIVIQDYSTKEGCWNFTRGIVYRADDEKRTKPICDVKRNYSAFPYLFVEREDGDFLVAGESYTSQDVYNLRNGEHYKPKTDDEFCWAEFDISPNGKIIHVDGCYWAGPYEHRFYDFSNPSEGWPLIEFENKEEVYDRRCDSSWADEDELELEEEPKFQSHWNEDNTYYIINEGKIIYLPFGEDVDYMSIEEMNKIPQEHWDEREEETDKGYVSLPPSKSEHWEPKINHATTFSFDLENKKSKIVDEYMSDEFKETLKVWRERRAHWAKIRKEQEEKNEN